MIKTTGCFFFFFRLFLLSLKLNYYVNRKKNKYVFSTHEQTHSSSHSHFTNFKLMTAQFYDNLYHQVRNRNAQAMEFGWVFSCLWPMSTNLRWHTHTLTHTVARIALPNTSIGISNEHLSQYWMSWIINKHQHSCGVAISMGITTLSVCIGTWNAVFAQSCTWMAPPIDDGSFYNNQYSKYLIHFEFDSFLKPESSMWI